MRVAGDVPLEVVVWLTESPEAELVRSLAAALPSAEWTLTELNRARLLVRGTQADVEPLLGQRWTGLVSGRVDIDAGAPGGARAPFRPYVLEQPGPPLQLESCWFALDLDGHVGCFDRLQLGAAPMKRCWGPRPGPAAGSPEPGALVRSIAGHHAPTRESARAYTFVADAAALARELGRAAPQPASRRWTLIAHEGRVIVSAGQGTTGGEPIAPAFIAWLHARGLCEGCARSALRDARLTGAYVYQSLGANRAAPYERASEPFAPWTAEVAAAALHLSLDALRRSVLPVRFSAKDRLQPIEYVSCTWSETVPWESEAGERHGVDVSARRR